MSGILAVYFVALALLVGASIGVVAAAVSSRSRFRVALAVRAGGFAGLVFVIAAVLVGLADSHSVFYNGRPTAPWREFAEHGLAICVISSVAAELLSGVGFRTSAKKD